MATVTPDQVLAALAECRAAVLDATTVVARNLTTVEAAEGGLDHVRRQLQNADIILMFMERAWRVQKNHHDMTLGRIP